MAAPPRAPVSAFSRWGSACHQVEPGVSRFIPSTPLPDDVQQEGKDHGVDLGQIEESLHLALDPLVASVRILDAVRLISDTRAKS